MKQDQVDGIRLSDVSD